MFEELDYRPSPIGALSLEFDNPYQDRPASNTIYEATNAQF